MFEFMLVVTVMLLVLTFAVLLKEQRTSQVEHIEQHSDANSVCELLSTSIDQVHSGGEGSGMTVEVPQQIQFKDYTPRISSDKTVVLTYENQTIFCSFKAEVSNGTSDAFEVPKTLVTLSNQGEVVLIS